MLMRPSEQPKMASPASSGALPVTTLPLRPLEGSTAASSRSASPAIVKGPAQAVPGDVEDEGCGQGQRGEEDHVNAPSRKNPW